MVKNMKFVMMIKLLKIALETIAIEIKLKQRTNEI